MAPPYFWLFLSGHYNTHAWVVLGKLTWSLYPSLGCWLSSTSSFSSLSHCSHLVSAALPRDLDHRTVLKTPEISVHKTCHIHLDCILGARAEQREMTSDRMSFSHSCLDARSIASLVQDNGHTGAWKYCIRSPKKWMLWKKKKKLGYVFATKARLEVLRLLGSSELYSAPKKEFEPEWKRCKPATSHPQVGRIHLWKKH